MKKKSYLFNIAFVVTIITLAIFLFFVYKTNRLDDEISENEKAIYTQLEIFNQMVYLEGIAHDTWISSKILKSLGKENSPEYEDMENDHLDRAIDYLSILYNITEGTFPNEITIASWRRLSGEEIEDKKIDFVKQFEEKGVYKRILEEKRELVNTRNCYFSWSLVFQFLNTVLFAFSGFLFGKKS